VDQLLLPVAYTLEGRQLVLDAAQTRVLLGEWATIYRRLAGLRGNGAAALHTAAGTAYSELSRATP
jgi:hypothetical protein